MRLKWLFPIITILFSCNTKRESTKPKRETLINTVYSSVTIEPENVYKVNSTFSGNIEDILIQEGELVKKGDILFVLANKPQRLNQENEMLNHSLLLQSYKGRSNVLDDLKLEFQSARINFQNDSSNYYRFQKLYQQNACSKIELEKAQMAYELANRQLKSVHNKITRKENELNTQLNLSQNNVQISSLRTADGIISSRIDGKLFQVFKKKGEYVSLQEPIAIIGDHDKFLLKLLVDEVDISKIKVGQKVLVELEAYNNQVFEARVSKIAPKMEEKTQTFVIEAKFVKAPPKLYMGLTGEANILIDSKHKALVIPRDYLLPGNKVETDKGLVSVKTGMANWDYIEILSGITEKTLIYKPK
jgi:RND family efflux transporter MFP subunit